MANAIAKAALTEIPKAKAFSNWKDEKHVHTYAQLRMQLASFRTF